MKKCEGKYKAEIQTACDVMDIDSDMSISKECDDVCSSLHTMISEVSLLVRETNKRDICTKT
jgi:hypothetical protein